MKLTKPNSTKRLRDIRDAILLATEEAQGCVTHSVAIHFFEDCWLGFHTKSNSGTYPKFVAKVSTKDGKIWKNYNDELEPAEGYHEAVTYDPTYSPFPK